MGELLERMGQHHDIKPIGREATKAIINVFLNNIQPFTHCGNQLVRVDINAYSDHSAFISEALQKPAVPAAEVQDATACGDPAQHSFEI